MGKSFGTGGETGGVRNKGETGWGVAVGGSDCAKQTNERWPVSGDLTDVVGMGVLGRTGRYR